MNDKITLGGKEYSIAPLSLGQMRKVGPCFTRIGIDTPEGMDAQLTIIYHGMLAADTSVTPAQIDAIKGVTFEEIRTAVEKIGTMCGLKMTAKEVPAGEGKPAPSPAVH
jgi:hypothetical protein